MNTQNTTPAASYWTEPNGHGGFAVWKSLGAAREQVATFKREKDAKSYCAFPSVASQLERLIALISNQDVTINRPGEDIRAHLAPAIAALAALQSK